MKNKLLDLNNHLFAQLERLGEEDLTDEQMERETARTNAIVKVSEQIIDNATVALNAAKLTAEYGGNYEKMLPLIENKSAAMEPIPDAQPRNEPRIEAVPKKKPAPPMAVVGTTGEKK
ncbi:MAG TPA: hypothetical protein VHW09_27150 [Bryobacteraceae bacterium]|jgi:hypothetical protein|nr:hypothetical protein [Bryobacteraceae bacterium]